ncbi:MAG: glycosyltransferase family 9 protein [Desulfobacterales bacterium]|nr:glycosyltransferase family 9 protein [Desulfobacterales bacterium]
MTSSFKSFFEISIIFITYIFDTIVLALTKKPTISHGLAVIRMDAIGDFILWLDTAKELQQLYPETKITLIANQIWADLAALLPYWDKVVAIDRKSLIRNPAYRLKMLRRIRRWGFESAIQATFSREFRYGDSVIRASGALHRVGAMCDLSNITQLQRKISNKWYSHLVPSTDSQLTEIERNAEFIRRIGLPNFTPQIPILPKLKALTSPFIIQKPYFVLFPGASDPIRRWPVEYFSEILCRLITSTGMASVLCGSKEERSLCERIINVSGMVALNLAGDTTLSDLVELIRDARLLISNETSAIHIAAAVSTPSVCILGGGHYGRFLPYNSKTESQIIPIPVTHKMDCYNCNWICTQPHEQGKPAPCISKINVEQVLESVKRILNCK